MNKEIEHLHASINKGLEQLNLPKSPSNLYNPIDYILSLGGKRVRPMLALLSYKMYQQNAEEVIKPILALEVFHNFTLVHDDIMDEAPLRRGKETVHSKWNSNIAILSGDVMLVKAYELLSCAPKELLPVLLDKFNACAQEVCEGQQKDMDFESQPYVSVDEYLDMIRKKTAVLLGFSLELGAILGGATQQDCDKLYEVGVNLGIAFQLQDDLLDLYGGIAFGKQVGGDVINKKKSYLITKALELSPEKRASLLATYNADIDLVPDKINIIKQAFDELNIQDNTRLLIEKYETKATENINQLVSSNKHMLFEYFKYLKSRTQ